jgi:hypothetical protein
MGKIGGGGGGGGQDKHKKRNKYTNFFGIKKKTGKIGQENPQKNFLFLKE